MHLFTRYWRIDDLPINGNFVNVKGNIRDHITGIGWIGSPMQDDFTFISSRGT
jgi:hypothetical protein